MKPTELKNLLRKDYLDKICHFLEENGEEVLQVASNKIACPCVDKEGNEEFIVLTFTIPSGSRDGEAYDAYGEADSYKLNCAQKAEKAKELAEKKAKKIAKDAKLRESKAKIAEKRAE